MSIVVFPNEIACLTGVEMINDDLVPPELPGPFSQGVYTTFKVGMDQVPILSAISGLIEQGVVNFKEKNLHEWQCRVADALIKLEISMDDLRERLEGNKKALEIVYLAAQTVQTTSEQEKIEALKNAAINSTLDESTNVAKERMFLTYLRDYSGLHLRILKIFQNPEVEFLRQNKADYAKNKIYEYDKLLEQLLPTYSEDPELCERVVKSLHTEGLLLISSLHEKFKISGVSRPAKIPDFWVDTVEISEKNYLTQFGNDFMMFISPPISESIPG